MHHLLEPPKNSKQGFLAPLPGGGPSKAVGGYDPGPVSLTSAHISTASRSKTVWLTELGSLAAGGDLTMGQCSSGHSQGASLTA